MVTHQLSLLAEIDVNVIMRDGRFDYCGPFNTDVLLVRILAALLHAQEGI